MDGARPKRGLLRQVLVPSEHGGWSFLAEPVLLGLLVAPSFAGMLVALAALFGFLARRPLRIAVSDRRLNIRTPRTLAARAAFAACAFAGAGALAGAVAEARGPMLVAVGLAAVPGVVALAFDLRGKSREAGAEIAAGLALGGIASAIALAAGRPTGSAFTLWGILAARIVPTILFVRARVRLDRDAVSGVTVPLFAHAVALVAMIVAATWRVVPWTAAAVMAVLLARAAWGLSRFRWHSGVRQLGFTEVGFGLITVLAVGLSFRKD